MVDVQRQRALQSRRYCTDRLAELKEEISRFQAESDQLKSELNGVDEPAAGNIRLRRRYLSRRLEELKAERAARTSELEDSTARLQSTASATG